MNDKARVAFAKRLGETATYTLRIAPRPFEITFRHSCIPLVLALALCFVVCPAAAGSDWTDPVGDVTLPNADIVSGSATVSGGMVDLRVQFANAPFPNTATHNLHWFFDLDQNGATGENYGGASVVGAEKFISMTVRLSTGTFAECEIQMWGTISGINYQSHLWFDPASNTLRMFFPLSLLQDDGIFNYVLDSTFGGSSGANERAPDSGTVTSTTTTPPPFNGRLWCPSGNDSDRDGVPDSTDECPNSIQSATVVLGECDSGVANRVLPSGCTILDLISPCREVSRNHGRFVVCVAKKTAELKAAGVLTKKEKRAIDRCAARSRVGHPK